MTAETIIAETAAAFGLTARDILSDRRTQHIAHARQAAMLLTRELLPWLSVVDIGRAFRRDHTTVLHALDAARSRGRTYPAYQRAILQAKAALETTGA